MASPSASCRRTGTGWSFFCGPESFTADVKPLIGPAPELDGYFIAAGLNSLGILSGGGVGSAVAQWIVDGVPPVDTAHIAPDRTAEYETSRRFRAERTTEQLGVLFGDAAWPAWQPKTGRNIRRSVLHDRLAAAGAHFGQSAGWEFTEWFATRDERPEPAMSFGRPTAHALVGREHATVREAVGMLDMSLMAKLIVQGPDAAAVLSRLSANDVTARLGRLVYTQWLDMSGGIVADLTVTWLEPEKFLVIASDVIHRRVEPLIRRETRPGELVTVTDVTSATTLLSVQGPSSRELIGRLSDADLSNHTFPYLAAQAIDVGYAPVLAIRVTYVGELGWELHVPTEFAAGVYDDLMAAGADLGFRPVGLQAMSSLRLEKGYRDMGVDIDNTDNPLQAGLGFAVAWDKPGGFVGRDALLAAKAAGPPQDRLVSLLAEDPKVDLFGNEPVLLDGSWVGYVRAAAFGYTLGAAVGLAQVRCEDGVTADWLKAGRFEARTPGGDVPVRLQPGPLYDPRRLRILDE
jgi:heterotetrameric sarcosine oxidase gamma subunit